MMNNYNKSLIEKYQINNHALKKIRATFINKMAWFTVHAIMTTLRQKLWEDEAIWNAAGIDRATFYRWIGGKSAPNFPAIDLLMKRSGLDRANLQMPPFDYQRKLSLWKTTEFVKKHYVEGDCVPARLSEPWIECLDYIADRVRKRAGRGIADEQFARAVACDAKEKLPRIGNVPIEKINEFLDNWFDAYSLTVGIISDLLEQA